MGFHYPLFGVFVPTGFSQEGLASPSTGTARTTFPCLARIAARSPPASGGLASRRFPSLYRGRPYVRLRPIGVEDGSEGR
jgi:hypothetical protein